jgi:mono/diheme cytochrome c family protein
MRVGVLLPGVAAAALLVAGGAVDLRGQEPGGPAVGDDQATELVVDEALARRGRTLFQNKGCNACHTLGRAGAGPDLVGATDRRDVEWLRRFIKDPGPMLDSDPVAMELLKEWKGQRMPNMRLSDQEVEAVMHYLAQETARRRDGK